MMRGKELKEKYLNFFKERGHQIIPSASLIPENDPSALFISAGMHPLIPYLLGGKHPQGKRLVNAQKCLRTGDIDEVGDNWHNTFFQMLGNWSLGDYFKEEAIMMSWQFLIERLKINPEKIYITVFAGDKDAQKDSESIKIWQEQFRKLGINAQEEERIFSLSKKDNWWDSPGESGPCGPDTEIFFDTDKERCGFLCKPGCSCGKYVEIWNNVFMEYRKTKEGKYESLKQKNVDTGMGMERTLAVLEGKDNVYETEFFQPIFDKIIELSGKKGVSREEIIISDQQSLRVIADHLRASVFLLGDDLGIVPSNLDQGYILRRFIRRVIRHGKLIGMNRNKDFCAETAKTIISEYKEEYPELERNRSHILDELRKEEEKFEKTLEKGLSFFKKVFEIKKEELSGKAVFNLFQNYGFPFEMTEELAKEKNIFIIRPEEFKEEVKKHQDLSRQGAAKKFKGGLAEQTRETSRLHTATHLLHQALRDVLGKEVKQKGSNITRERLRFDFSYPRKMNSQEIERVERIVNEKIKDNLKVISREMTLEEAKKEGAMAFFEDKYGEKVKVYSMGDYSKEVCAGPHVDNTGELGKFKIIKESASSAGVRRIKAILS